MVPTAGSTRDNRNAADFQSAGRTYSDHQEASDHHRGHHPGVADGGVYLFGRNGGLAESSLSQSAGILRPDRSPVRLDQSVLSCGGTGQLAGRVLPVLEICGTGAAPQGAALGHSDFSARGGTVCARPGLL